MLRGLGKLGGAVAGAAVDFATGRGYEDGDVTDPGVEALLERLANSVLAEDRRAATVELRDLVAGSAQAQLAVGAIGYPVLLGVLVEERDDLELVRGALEVLVAALAGQADEDGGGGDGAPGTAPPAGAINAESLSQDGRRVALLLTLLEEEDFYVRYHTAQLLNALGVRHGYRLQEVIMANPMGVARLMDLMLEREVIRNEALLLLTSLTRGNEEIQKIVAFEGAFERLFNIVREEGGADGGIIVQDCLELLNNLIRGNVSNQVFFREGSFAPRLVPMLQLRGKGGASQAPLPRQAAANLLGALEAVSLLLAPAGDDVSKQKNRAANQAALTKGSAIDALLPIAVEGAARSVPVRTQALRCIGDLVDGFAPAQEALSVALVAGTSLSEDVGGAGDQVQRTMPALSAVLRIALHAADAGERFAAERVFMQYCRDNSDSQNMLVSTIAPVGSGMGAEDDGGPDTPFGGILVRALIGNDMHTSCRAASVLQHLISGNRAAKERLLRTPLEMPASASAIPELLMPRCFRYLSTAAGSSAWVVQASLLRLLIGWLYECPAAAAAFLAPAAHLPFLADLAKSTDVHVAGLAAVLLGACMVYNEAAQGVDAHTVLDVVASRLGLQKYFARWDAMRRSDLFSAAAAAPRLPKAITRATAAAATSEGAGAGGDGAGGESAYVYDHAFAAFVTQFDEAVKARVIALYARPKPVLAGDTSVWEVGEGESEKVHVQRLKALLRSQDMELAELRARNAMLAEQALTAPGASATPAEGASAPVAAPAPGPEAASAELTAALDRARASVAEEVAAVRAELAEVQAEKDKAEESLQALSQAYNTLEGEAFRHEEEARSLRSRVDAAGAAPTAAPAAIDPAVLEKARAEGWAQGVAQGKADLEALLAAAKEEAAEAAGAEHEAEMNDLLVCLGQEESKVERLRGRLEEMGEDVDALLEGVGEEGDDEEEEDEDEGADDAAADDA